jgi:energy-coupling factor transporter ATP-binding protein EcfA2
MKFHIDPSERWIIIGKTGSGKSEFAKYMLREIAKKYPVVIIDPKEFWMGRSPQFETNRKKPGTIDKPHRVNSFNPKFRVQLLQPDPDDPDDERLARMCKAVLDHGDVFMYFDESEDIATAHAVPYYIRRIWKTGRAKGVGAWVSTQAPTGIPRIFKSQAEHFITFKVGEQDVDTVADLVHADPEEVRKLQKFHYLYYNTDMDSAVHNIPVPYKEKRHA